MNDDYRARCVTHEVIRDRPKEHACEGAVTVAPHDKQVCVPGGGQEDGSRVALRDNLLNGDAGIGTERLGDRLVE